MDLYGKTVLVTGASRGIGEAIAVELTRAGAVIVGVARDSERLNGAMRPIKGIPFVCDLGDQELVSTLVNRIEQAHGQIDVLINNAGIDSTGPFLGATSKGIRDIITLNQIVPIDLTRQALVGMQRRGSGHIVNISSLAACGGFAGMTLYSSSKSGLSGFHRVLRHELRNSPIGMTLVEIGPIQTDLLANAYDHGPASNMFARFRRLHLLPEVSRERVARNVRRAIAKNKPHVCLPRRGSLYPTLTGAPQRIVDILTSTISR